MNAIVKQSPPQDLSPAPAETANVLAMISRAASDPQCDLDKMERLLNMHERMVERQARAEFAADLAAMQSELPSIGERGKADRYKFALWEDINQAIKPVMQRFGFALTFRTETDKSQITVTGVLSHKSGHREETSITLPADTSGSKNPVQAVGSSTSYGKRYTAGALLNLTSHGEDDDAFSAATGYDPTEWLDSIKDAADKSELDRLAAELRTAKNIPDAALKGIRKAWAERAKELAQ